MIDLLFRKKNIDTGIEVSEGWVKVAWVATRGSRRRLLRLAANRIPASLSEEQKTPPKDFKNAIFTLLKGFAKPGFLISSIARKSVTIRFLNLPSVNPKEIEGMLEFQATKQLPFPKEELIVGHRILGVDVNGYSKVMLVIAHKDIIDQHFSMLKECRLLPSKMGLSTEGILNHFLYTYSDLEQVQKQQVYMVIDIDYQSTEILILKGNQILFSRSIALQGVVGDVLIDEIRRSLIAFRKERALEKDVLAKIFIAGRQDHDINQLCQQLSKEFSIEAVMLECFKNIDISRRFKDILKLPKEVSFWNVLGLALNRDALKIDLMPRGLKKQRQARQRRSEIIRLGTLSLFLVVLLCTLGIFRLYTKKVYSRYIDKELVQIEPKVKRVNLTFDKLKVIRKQARKDGTALEILKECYKIIPADVNLSLFSFHEDEGVVLRGTSKVMSRVFEMVSILEGSIHFKDVKVVYANKRKVEGEVITDFQISCGLAP